MIALEAKYHRNCLSSLYNKHRQFCTSITADEGNTHLHGIAFAELISYLEDVYAEADISPVFKLIDLAKLYQLGLKQLGIKENRVDYIPHDSKAGCWMPCLDLLRIQKEGISS